METNTKAASYRFRVLGQRDDLLMKGMEVTLAEAARRSGDHLVCRPGCSQCCHGAFPIDALDALRLRSAMETLKELHPTQAARIEARAVDYLMVHGPAFPGGVVTGILGTSAEEQAAFEDFANEAACPALDPETGLCEMYDARPMTCRAFGPPVPVDAGEDGTPAFSVCELCFTEASPEEIAECAIAVPYEEEQRLVAELSAVLEAGEVTQPGETIVAFCLTGQRP